MKHRRPFRSRWAFALLAALALALPACGDDDGGDTTISAAQRNQVDSAVGGLQWPTPVAETVGKLTTGSPYVGVVEHAGGKVTAYVCDGPSTALWFEGTLTGGKATLTHASGATLTLDKTATGFAGTVTIGGTTSPFTTGKATHPAGVWEGFRTDPSTNQAIRYGWIVLADGSQKGAKVQTTATGDAGTLDTDASLGSDGTAAVPAAPPPPTTTGLTAERCQELQDLANKVADDFIDAPDERRKTMYLRALQSTKRKYDDGGCKDTLGENYLGTKI
jgi:hypothetical protein